MLLAKLYNTALHLHLMFCMQLLAGFLISLSSLPVYLRWLKYLSIFHYSIEVSESECLYIMYTCTYCPEAFLSPGTGYQ